jgi:acetylglutamate kinase
MKETVEIIKIGGKVLNDTQHLDSFIEAFSQVKGMKILVHGGGNQATDLSNKLGIENKLVNGRRITDKANLEVVLMVYAGLLNKMLVAKLQSRDINALGLSGADYNTILAQRRVHPTIDYGEVGDIDPGGVNINALTNLLMDAVTPVFCAITHDGNGNLFNTNADTIASELAIAMSVEYNVNLTFCFEHKGVLRDLQDPDSWIKDLDYKQYQSMIKTNAVSEGMLPKLDNAFHVLSKRVNRVNIKNSSYLNSSVGTQITL